MTSLHLPMGLMWHMPVPVGCSLAVSVEGLAISCGQCPLDREGRVLHPNDPEAQAGLVASMAQAVLDHLPSRHHAAMLVIYHDAPDAGMVTVPLAQAFPGAILAPVRLPHFYYPGMQIEVDVYAVATPTLPTVQSHGPACLKLTTTGPLTLCHLTAPDMAAASALLSGLNPAHLLSAQWFASDAPPADWHPDPSATVRPADGAGVSAILTLVDATVAQSQTPGGALRRQAGQWVWLSAVGQSANLAQAAHQAMDLLALERQPELTLVKATTHYVGGPGPDDLHGNLAVRHARFPRPGPASTGVPVAGLAGGMLAMDVLAVVGQPGSGQSSQHAPEAVSTPSDLR